MLCRHKKVPYAVAWLGLVSYSLYLLHPVLIEVYDSVPWTRNQNFVPTELLLVAVFLLVLLVCCGLTHRLIEAPMQRLGRRVTRRLDVRFGPDTARPSPRRRPCGNAMRPLFQCVLTYWNPGFTASGTTGYLAWPVLLPGSAATVFFRRSFRVSGLLSGRFRVPFRRTPGTVDWRVIPMAARSRARPGEVANPAAVSRGTTLGVTARLPDATDSLVTDSEI
jgi:hypothetical protein